MMNSKIVETLETMCDKDNPQDKKLLLLAELVETKCDALGQNQTDLKESLDKNYKKLEEITKALDRYESKQDSCPVSQNREYFENFILFSKYPKISFLVMVGVFALLVGVFSSTATDLLKFLFGV